MTDAALSCLASMVASYPNSWLLMGPNSVTGHSSALFNTECTVEMMANLLKPVVKALKAAPTACGVPAPTVEVTQAAEDEWYAAMRAEMSKKVWEMDGGIVRLRPVPFPLFQSVAQPSSSQSWYVDPAIGKCTTLCRSTLPGPALAHALSLSLARPRSHRTCALTCSIWRSRHSPLEPARVHATDPRDAPGALRLVALPQGLSAAPPLSPRKLPLPRPFRVFAHCISWP